MRPAEQSSKPVAPSRMQRLLFGCVFGAAVLNGILSSGINRTLIDMPAWQHVGASAWAAFSQWADLGAVDMILYPLEGIGGAVLSVGAALIVAFNRRRLPSAAVIPVSLAAFFALLGMLATTQAAPTITSTAQHLSDPASLQQALHGFWLWGGVRAGSLQLHLLRGRGR